MPNISDLLISDDSGAELRFVADQRKAEVITTSGEFDSFGGDKIDEIFAAERVAFWLFPSNAVVMLGEGSPSVLRFSLSSPRFEVIAKLNRFEVLEEGFDYNKFLEHKGTALLCYEFGIVKLNRHGEIAWHRQFDDLLTYPELSKGHVVYSGITDQLAVDAETGDAATTG